MSFSLSHPASVADAVALAQQLGESARFIAGGTDLIIQINRRRCAPTHLIDLNCLSELSGIEEGAEGFSIGALTTHKDVERHPAFQKALAALSEAARVVGGHQIRNMGTVGGNIVNASPAADLVPPLLALEAELTLSGPDGARRVRLEDFLLGPGRTARRPGELLSRIAFRALPPQSATAFIKAGRRKAMEISVVCVAARLTLGDHGCRDVRIALGAVGGTALRAHAAEQLLEGNPPSAELFREAGRLAMQVCAPISDVRASARYRSLLVEALVPRALERCLARIEAG